ncbi:hypothetical protein JOM56_010075 [Amanita muscaria]
MKPFFIISLLLAFQAITVMAEEDGHHKKKPPPPTTCHRTQVSPHAATACRPAQIEEPFFLVHRIAYLALTDIVVATLRVMERKADFPPCHSLGLTIDFSRCIPASSKCNKTAC